MSLLCRRSSSRSGQLASASGSAVSAFSCSISVCSAPSCPISAGSADSLFPYRYSSFRFVSCTHTHTSHMPYETEKHSLHVTRCVRFRSNCSTSSLLLALATLNRNYYSASATDSSARAPQRQFLTYTSTSAPYFSAILHLNIMLPCKILDYKQVTSKLQKFTPHYSNNSYICFQVDYFNLSRSVRS